MTHIQKQFMISDKSLSKLILIVTAMLMRYNFIHYTPFYYANSEVHETKPLINDDFLLCVILYDYHGER